MKTLPPSFKSEIEQLLGAVESLQLCNAIAETVPPVSIRINPNKPQEKLPFDVDEPVKWCSQWGRYLPERPRFTYDPLLHAGCYYVQEASSMFIARVYQQIATDIVPQRMLDLCAAPGGKSTLWRTLLPNDSLLVANDPIRQRAQVLAENLTKWGHPNVVVTSAYPDEFASLGSFFDVVATDVPCSGEGMFRKDDGAVEEWSLDNVLKCADRQWEIINSVWPSLREGGYLVYSTCTFNRQENEDNVQRICQELGAELVPIDIEHDWGIVGDTTMRSMPVYHFFPHKAKGEGLFLALLRKTSSAPIIKSKKTKKRQSVTKQAGAIKEASKISTWLNQPNLFKLLPYGEGRITAVAKSWADDVQRIMQTMKTLVAGVAIAEEKGHKIVPQHALALSVVRNEQAFPHAELSLDEALAYLRREAIVLPSDIKRGYVVATYMGHALGFLNNLGTRANNLYPQEWRIRN